ncbi:MAG: hypothetical protein H6907_11955 [Hyphomicrobiales bacterium]|nr:hypothetical protein [Hyphomicrobiales bacterium]MCP5372436.1 hypothetical protein [Hyphomicrobiales bacterium]
MQFRTRYVAFSDADQLAYLDLLAGTADFMDAYLARAGGLEAVQERFHYMHVADTEFNHIPGDEMDAFYRMLGWEPFEHDFDRHRDWDEIAQLRMRLGRAHPKYMGPYKD